MLSSVSANSTTCPTPGMSITAERSLPPAGSIAAEIALMDSTLIVTRNALIAPCAAGPRRFAISPREMPCSTGGPVWMW